MSPCSSTVPDSVLLDSVASPDPPGDSTLARLTEHVRALLPVDAVAIVTEQRFAGWFADRKLGEALGGDALAALPLARGTRWRGVAAYRIALGVGALWAGER